MSEFFLELFSEEIPAGLQRNSRNVLLESFQKLFEEKQILFKKEGLPEYFKSIANNGFLVSSLILKSYH